MRGYRKEAIEVRASRRSTTTATPRPARLASLACAREAIRGETVRRAYGDMLFRRYILDSLLGQHGATSWSRSTRSAGSTAAAAPSRTRPGRPPTGATPGTTSRTSPAVCFGIGNDIPSAEVCGEWIGLANFSADGAAWLARRSRRWGREGLLETGDLPLLLTRLAAGHRSACVLHRPLARRRHARATSPGRATSASVIPMIGASDFFAEAGRAASISTRACPAGS